MTRRGMVVVWLFSFAYTAYVCGVVVASLAVLGDAAGAPVGFALAIGPVIVGSIWMAGR